MSPLVQFGLLLLVGMALFSVAFLLRKEARKLRLSVAGEALEASAVSRKLDQINQMIALDDPASSRLAVLELYKLFDMSLKQLRVPGETMGERLTLAQEDYPRVAEMRVAYDLAHQLNANPGASVTGPQVAEVRRLTTNALKTLRIL